MRKHFYKIKTQTPNIKWWHNKTADSRWYPECYFYSPAESLSASSYPPNIHWVDTMEMLERACDRICQFSCVGFDMEGRNLDKADGVTSLLQIAVSPWEIFVFDIQKLGSQAFHAPPELATDLSKILGNQYTIKLCYDCRCDAQALVVRHGLKLCSFYDLQIVYTLLFQSHRDPYLKGMHRAMQCVSLLSGSQNEIMKQKAKQFGNSFMSKFMDRPLSKEALDYCVGDVVSLLWMHQEWSRYIFDDVVMALTHKRIFRFLQLKSKDSQLVMSRLDFGIERRYLRKHDAYC
jgi:hypothetical protein